MDSSNKLMPAGMRGGYHTVALAGCDMSFSLSAGILTALGKETQFVEHFDEPVAQETIDRLLTIPEFQRAYDVDALPEAEFIRYGASQRTLSQFVEAGWSMIGEFKL